MERAKVAVAVALIRMKPPGVTGKEYTRQLSERYQNKQVNWKEQYEKAENEILHLKEKLFMQNTNQEQHESQDFANECSQKLFPTPPNSGSLDHSHQMKNLEGQSAIIQNTEFLHHVINIQTGSKHLSSDGSSKGVIRESVQHSLQVLQNHVGKNTISWTIQKQCVQCVVDLMNRDEPYLQTSLQDSILNLCYSMIQTLLHSKNSTHENKENHVHLLAMFGDCKPIQGTLVDLLCETIKDCSKDLKQYIQKKIPLDTVKFCNSYYLLRTCELSLSSNNGNKLEELVKFRAKEKLEESLLNISYVFPLYAHMIWRICANLTAD